MSSTRELAHRIDATAAEIAELAERVDALEDRVAAARRLAQEVEAELARSRATGESLPALARQTFMRGFGLLVFGSLGLIAFVAIAILSSLPGSCASDYRFSAEGSVIAAPDRAMLAASCDVEVEESGRHTAVKASARSGRTRSSSGIASSTRRRASSCSSTNSERSSVGRDRSSCSRRRLPR